MLNETFYLDGISADSVGICLQNPPIFSSPVPVVEKKHIPGRNGDLIFEDGVFENRTGKFSCYSVGEDVETKLRAVNNFLFSKMGYRKLETDNDKEHFWMARVKSGARMEIRNGKLAPYEINFDCKPQRFLKSGEEEIITNNDIVVVNPTIFDSKPIIKIYGTSPVTFYIGRYKVEVLDLSTSPIEIDCDTMEIHGAASNLSDKVKLEEFPILEPGENRIRFIEEFYGSIRIYPRWWEL